MTPSVSKKSILFFLVAVSLSASAVLAHPTARTDAEMVYDSQNRRILLFGGTTAADSSRIRHSLNDTWEWTGRRWLQLFPEHQPEKRAGFAMAYDINRSRVVLFGGADIPKLGEDEGVKFFSDTWIFADDDWSRIDTPSSPSARRYTGFTYDPIADRFYIVGGADATTVLYDTWAFDGTTWTQVVASGPKVKTPLLVYDVKRNAVLMLGIGEANTTEMYQLEEGQWKKLTPAHLPLCPVLSSMVYQVHNEKVALVGGACPIGGGVSDTWEWDGSDWTKVETRVTAGIVFGQAMAYDEVRNETLIFGGTTFSERSDTFRYRDGNWLRTGFETTFPGPRSLFVFEGDPVEGVAWLFGGHDDVRSFSDLWRYSSGRWEPIPPVNAPAGCIYPAGAFDTDRKRLVIVCQDSAIFEWSGSEWFNFQNLSDKPPSRRFSSMVYDPTLKKTILYGGYGGDYVRETWTWDGAKWTKIARKDPSPDMRALAALFYDPISRKTILFGGIGRRNSDSVVQRYNDQWSFDGTKWTLMAPPKLPSPRYGTQLELDPLTNKTVMFGGKNETETYINEQWEWNGTTWTQVEAANAPSPRMNGSLVFDPSSQRLTLFGGYAGGYFSELWVLEGSLWRIVPGEIVRRRSPTRRPAGGSP